MTIGRKDNKVVPQAMHENGQIRLINGSTMGKLLRRRHTIMVNLFLIEIENVKGT